ncbi:MAG TPA: DUF5011 domain-containing protein, partial [Candidatus Hydrogenedentes bacterium]|nr:DUF5011 domain-containing protein [Candidatus Hydrogenedentota bacterium]
MALRTVAVIDEAFIELLGDPSMTHECGYAFDYNPEGGGDDPGAVAYDVDGTELTVERTGAFDEGELGSYVLTYTAQPLEGDPLTAKRTVEVVDTEPPQIGVPGAPIEIECGDVFEMPGTPLLYDMCDGLLSADDLVVAHNVDPDTPGTYSIDYSIEDSQGLVGMASRAVNVVDTTEPALTLLGDPELDFECDTIYEEYGVDLLEICDGDLTVSNVMVSVWLYEKFKFSAELYSFETQFNDTQVGNGGEYLIQYAAEDASGNVGTVDRLLTIDCPETLELRVAGELYDNFGNYDTSKGDGILDDDELVAAYELLVAMFPNLTPVRFASIITAIRVYDENGDVTLPAIADYIGAITPVLDIVLLGDNPMDTECGVAFADPGAEVRFGEVVLTVINGAGDVDTATLGAYTLTYQYTHFGQEAEVQRTVNVVDNTPPELFGIPGDGTRDVECGSVYDPLEGVGALDSCEGLVSGDIVVGGDTVDTSVPGEVFTVTYDVQDSHGNAAETAELVVTIVDTTAPVVTIEGGDALPGECGQPIELPSATAADDCDPLVTTAAITDQAGLDPENPATGVYVVVYSAEDAAGNVGNATLTVTITDTTAPVVEIEGEDAIDIECGLEAVLPSATAQDDCDGALTVEITDYDGLDVMNPVKDLVHMLTYSATDAAGNTGTAQLSVTVVDTTAPEVTIKGPSEITVECGQPVTLPGATATDTCDGALVADVLNYGGLNTENPAGGLYEVVYSAQDNAGNESSAILTVT